MAFKFHSEGELKVFLEDLCEGYGNFADALWSNGNGIRCLAELVDAGRDTLERVGVPALKVGHLLAQAQLKGGPFSNSLPLPPPGSVLPIKERLRGGQGLQTVGTLSIISPSGKAATALHCVQWEDGKIHPKRLAVGNSSAVVKHLVSFPDLDVSVVQLVDDDAWQQGSSTPTGSQAASRTRGGRSSGGGSSSSGNSDSFPYIPSTPKISQGLPTGTQVWMHGYPVVLEQENLQHATDPCIVHGQFSNYDSTISVGIADYQGFKNMSGGPVVAVDGQDCYLCGIHTNAVTHGRAPPQPVQRPQPAHVMDDIVATEDEEAAFDQAGQQQQQSATITTPNTPRPTVKQVADRLDSLELEVSGLLNREENKSVLGLFVPWQTLMHRMRLAGVEEGDEVTAWAQLASANKRLRR